MQSGTLSARHSKHNPITVKDINMEQAQALQAPAALEKARAVDSFNKLYEKGERKKINPSKSRQGRAVLVNGALRNPFWEPVRYTSQGRNPGERKHPRTLKPWQIDDLKHEASTVIEAHNDYAAELTQEMDEYAAGLGKRDDHLDSRVAQHLNTLLLKAGKIRRRLECKVSRELDLRWTVNTVEGAESFTVKIPEVV